MKRRLRELRAKWLDGRVAAVGYLVVLLVLGLGILRTDMGLESVWVFMMVPIFLSSLVFPSWVARVQLAGFGTASLVLLFYRHPNQEVFLDGARMWAVNLTALWLGTELLGRLTAARARMEAALRTSERRYRLLFERNLAGVFRASADGRFLDCNPSFAQMLKLPSVSQVLQRCMQDFTAEAGTWEKMMAALREKRILTNHELRFQRADGTSGWALENISLLDDLAVGESVEGTLVDITERKQAEDALRDAATRDGLTGLHNRRELDRMLREEVDRAARYLHPLSVVLLDLDHFKRVNDVYGHLVGDEVLRWLGQQIQSHCRTTDRAARYGGEEFFILLPETTAKEALAVAERFRAHIEGNPFVLVADNGGPLIIPVTVSLGIAGLDPAGGTDEHLLERADRALYRAKHAGRNRAMLAEGLMPDRARRTTG